MKYTKLTLAALAAATMTAQAEIALSDELSLSGYIDFYAYESESDDDFETSAYEVELAFAFDQGGPVTAVAELSFDGTNANFETVTATYAASDELSFSIGNILSYQGFETYDATGLYQFSYQGLGPVYSAGYAVGASADYSTDDYALGFWIGQTDAEASIELFAQYTGIEGLTATAVYANDPGYETVNLWAAYEVGDFTFAAEYTTTDYDGGAELDALMGLVYYGYGDAGLTVRYSDIDYNGVDYTKLTISPSYAVTEDLFALAEVSFSDFGGAEVTEYAAEVIYTF